MNENVEISIVVPVYSGKDFLEVLTSKFDELRKGWGAKSAPIKLAEVIFVNDASRDGSKEILHDLEKKFYWIKIVNLSRNFGQHQATIAGILHSSGEWVVTLDEDLQHNPEYIDLMLKTAADGELDIVYAKPDKSVHESFFRDASSRLFKRFIARITGNSNVIKFNSFRLIRGVVARGASSVCSHGTYFDIALGWFSDRVGSLDLPMKDLRYIEKKTSGYSLWKLLGHARRMVISSEAKVLRLGAVIGFVSVILALVFGAKILFDKIANPASIEVQGWTSLFLTMLFFCGLLTLLCGIILEYLSVIILHIQGKPTFFVVNRMRDAILKKYYARMISDESTASLR